jgi:protein-tyrosine sulfotransferase
MLCRHSAFGGGPETLFFVKTLDLGYLGVLSEMPEAELGALRERTESIVEFAQEYYRLMAAREGKSRWVDKTPMHVRALPRILRSFPAARFVHVIRDGRDVACSLRNHPRERVHRGRVVPNRVDRPVGECASRWLRDTSLGLAFAGHPRVAEVRYEELVANPEDEMLRICRFLGESLEPAMLDPETAAPTTGRTGVLINNPNASEVVSRARVGRWRRDLSPTERRVVDRIAGELLIALGYVSDHAWVDQPS